MTQPFRLPRGGQIDRGRILRFSFDGQDYEGHPVDTLDRPASEAFVILGYGVTQRGKSTTTQACLRRSS